MLTLHQGDLIAERFRVETLIGEGGIARVFKVRHVRLGSVHAVKILTLARPSLADRLLLEGRIQAQLRHPNLVRVTDVVEHEGNPCLVMEFVDGSHLQALLHEQGSLVLPEALELFAGVLSAVAAAHDVGVLHRDLKPANILLERVRGRLVPKVSDFGIAKVAAEDIRLREGSTRQGVLMGTPGYMAPEQIEDSGAVDHRADIFALGAILYEMLSGRRPFDQETPFATMQATVAGRFAPIQSLVPDCPPHVATAIARCLEPRVADRFQGCHELADALYADAPVLRARIQKLEQEALPSGLHRPEITESTPRPSLSADGGVTAVGEAPPVRGAAGAEPGGSLPTPADTPDFATPGVEGATLAPPDDRLDRAPAPRALGPGSGGIRVDDSIDTEGAAGSLTLRTAGGSDAPVRPTGVTIGGDGDTAALDDLPEPPARSPLPWVAAVLLLIGAAGGGWWWMNQRGDGLPVETVDGGDVVLGEAVAPTDGEATPASADDAARAAAAEAAARTAAEAAVRDAAAQQAAARDAAETAAETAAREAAAETAAREAATREAAEAAAREAAEREAAAREAEAQEAAAREAEAKEAAAREAAAREAAAREAAAREAAAREAAAREAAEREAATAVSLPAGGETTPPPGDAVTDAEPDPEAPPPRPAPSLGGTWSGEANGRPLTLVLAGSAETGLTGQIRFTQGPIERVTKVQGRYDAETNRISLVDIDGSNLEFTGVVRGTGMMGTYGRKGDGTLSWSATRQ
ncbi:MAG: protein kinase [Alphaproteobacteria bacterium]|nr:protein kinase [Alphaproteobacteria bacterium]